MNQAVLIHLPHGSDHIPAEDRADYLVDDAILRRESIRLVDWHTPDLFLSGACRARSLVFPVSRLLVDPERFTEDTREPMAAVGMGVFYTRTSDGRPLRTPLLAGRRSELLESYYRPHHSALEAFAREALATHETALILDGHSFPAEALPCHDYGSAPLPDICLGTDPVHTPAELLASVRHIFEEAGFTVAIDHPFRGTIVPAGFLHRESRVLSIMIEINRALYLDADTAAPRADYAAFRKIFSNCIDQIITANKPKPKGS